jgi:RNA polymerase sigma factor (sigma-70 family)
MSAEGSVTTWISRLKAGDDEAARQLWERYHQELLQLARGLLRYAQRSTMDEEDVVLDVFERFFRAAKKGRYPRLRDRDGFWALLTTMAANRSRDELKYQSRAKRGGSRVRGESALLRSSDGSASQCLEQIAAQPAPEELAVLIDELAGIFERLGDPRVGQTIKLCADGFSHLEIAAKLGVSAATVRRGLRQAKLRA